MKALGERSIASFIRFVLDAAWWLVVVSLALLNGLLMLSFCVNAVLVIAEVFREGTRLQEDQSLTI